jgi:hypothetical protein
MWFSQVQVIKVIKRQAHKAMKVVFGYGLVRALRRHETLVAA